MNERLKPLVLQSVESTADRKPGGRVLIVSRDSERLAALGRVAGEMAGSQVTTRLSGIADLGARAAELFVAHDLVVFEVDPDDEAEMAALRKDLVRSRPATTRLLALTKPDLSLTQARALMQMGLDDVLPYSLSPEELKTAFSQKLQAAPQEARSVASAAPQARAGGAIIAVAASRGGVGATTVAVNLAALLLSHKGLFKKKPTKKVVLVDLDLQFGSAGVMLDIEDNGGMARILKSPTPPDMDFLKTIMVEHPSGLHVLTAPTEPVPLDAMKAGHVAGILDALRKEYDYVVVDMPRALVLWLEPLLKRTDRMLLVTDTSVPAIRQCRRLMDIYQEEHFGLNIEIVINGEKQPFMLSSHQKEAAKLLEAKFRNWLPRDEWPVRTAADRGVPLVTMSKRSPLSAAYRRLVSQTCKSLVANAARKG
jgi:pilus assembly protein CpaE